MTRKNNSTCTKVRTCGYCDSQYRKSEQGGYKYCSDPCKIGAMNAKQRKGSLTKQDILLQYGPRPQSKPDCAWCGKKTNRFDAIFCSKSCAGKGRKGNTALKAKLAAMAPIVYTTFSKLCVECSTRFTSKTEAVDLCSATCMALSGNKAKRGEDLRVCTVCAKQWVRPYGRGLTQVCSEECRSERIKQERSRYKSKTGRKYYQRALKLGAKAERFSPLDVLARDGWKCQLCGCSTPESLRGKNKPRSPELDHILPLSKGGDHTRINTQCLCRACNAAKSDAEIGQMLLIG